MHVAPADLRTLLQDTIIVRFAMLGSMAYVLAEIPESGSTGTSMEDVCVLPHWGFVIDGTITVEIRRLQHRDPARPGVPHPRGRSGAPPAHPEPRAPGGIPTGRSRARRQ